MTTEWTRVGAFFKPERLFLLAVVTLLFFLFPVSVEAALPEGMVPAALIRWPERNAKYAILVDKSSQKVLVYNTRDLSKPVRTYRCSTGENKGPKKRQNDKKTPEGIYFFTGAFEKQDLTPIYGTKAFPVDYPNELDLIEGKDGYGIWFHGTNKPLKPFDTNGCIALENGNIDTLANYIEINNTPAVISSRVEMVDRVALERERLALELLIEGWRSAWEGKQIDEYMKFYAESFQAENQDRHAWREHKEKLAEKYSWISVDIENLRLIRHDGTVLALFHQRYKSPFFDSRGIKRLYLRKNSEEWKIVGEYFTALDEKAVAYTAKPPDPAAVIRGLVGDWGKAWESQDIRAYMSFYDKTFRSRGMNVKEWRRHRQDLNRKYHTVRVGIRDLKIDLLDNSTARAVFVQDYRADDYEDYGIKELLLIKRGGHWKIKQEDWKALERNPG